MKYFPFLLAIAHGAVRGVSPEDQHLYQTDGTWSCLSDPSIVLSFDQINDNYCDCPDGSDEPGTNACNSNSLFYCENKGHFPGYVENFKLNDGVCDYDACCDGSDEYLTEVCPDRCAEINAQYEKYKSEVLENMRVALKTKEKYVEVAARARKEVGRKLQELKTRLEVKNQQVKKESSKKSSNALSDIRMSATTLVEDYENRLAAEQSRSRHLEAILARLAESYNPNFNDAGVKEAVANFQDYVSNKQDVEARSSDLLAQLEEVEARSTDLQGSNQPPTFSNMVRYYWGTKPVQEETVDESESTESAPDTELLSLTREIGIYEADLEADYGEADIFRAVANSWLTERYGDYTYRIGLRNAIYQDNTLVGSFERYEDGRLYFSNGRKCWNGPNRSAVVELICGTEEHLVGVSEPEKCAYLFQVSSPVVCEELRDEDIRGNFKVDYDAL